MLKTLKERKMNEKSSAPRTRGSSLKSYAARVFRESSVGMVSSLAGTPSKRRKCFKLLILILCLTGFLYQSAKFITVVFQYPTVVDVDIIRPNTFLKPAYTFCNNNGIKRSLFCEKYPDYCEEPDDALCEKFILYCGENKTLVPKKEFYRMVSNMSIEEMVELNTDIDHFVIPVRTALFSDTTGPYMRNTIDNLANVLLCYSMNERVNSTEEPVKGSKNPLARLPVNEMQFYIEVDEMFFPGVEPGILFSIHSPFVAGNPLENGIFMKPGRSYVIYVSMEEEVLLQKPYETDCINYTNLWEQNGRIGLRSQEMCLQLCHQELSMACFNCVAPFLIFPTNERICREAEMMEDTCPDNFDQLVENCKKSCRDDCQRVKYSSSVQERFSAKFLSSGELMENNDRIIDVKIYVEDDEILVLKHSPKYMIVEVFSTIGGFIGGWLGISLLDIGDIFEGFIRIIRYAFKRR